MENINRYIENTLLKPTLKSQDIDEFLKASVSFDFVGICIPPFWVKKVHRELRELNTQTVTVIGFPLGYNMTETKLEELRVAIKDGANELDLVMNISAFKSGMPWVKIEIAKCAKIAHDHDCLLKVIIETEYLSQEEIITACHICADAGADFVKTSTGFAASGAKLDDIQLMRSTLPSNVGIKASGGIKTRDEAIRFIEAGADRIGTSSGVNICES